MKKRAFCILMSALYISLCNLKANPLSYQAYSYKLLPEKQLLTEEAYDDPRLGSGIKLTVSSSNDATLIPSLNTQTRSMMRRRWSIFYISESYELAKYDLLKDTAQNSKIFDFYFTDLDTKKSAEMHEGQTIDPEAQEVMLLDATQDEKVYFSRYDREKKVSEIFCVDTQKVPFHIEELCMIPEKVNWGRVTLDEKSLFLSHKDVHKKSSCLFQLDLGRLEVTQAPLLENIYHLKVKNEKAFFISYEDVQQWSGIFSWSVAAGKHLVSPPFEGDVIHFGIGKNQSFMNVMHHFLPVTYEFSDDSFQHIQKLTSFQEEEYYFKKTKYAADSADQIKQAESVSSRKLLRVQDQVVSVLPFDMMSYQDMHTQLTCYSVLRRDGIEIPVYGYVSDQLGDLSGCCIVSLASPDYLCLPRPVPAFREYLKRGAIVIEPQYAAERGFGKILRNRSLHSDHENQLQENYLETVIESVQKAKKHFQKFALQKILIMGLEEAADMVIRLVTHPVYAKEISAGMALDIKKVTIPEQVIEKPIWPPLLVCTDLKKSRQAYALKNVFTQYGQSCQLADIQDDNAYAKGMDLIEKSCQFMTQHLVKKTLLLKEE